MLSARGMDRGWLGNLDDGFLKARILCSPKAIASYGATQAQPSEFSFACFADPM